MGATTKISWCHHTFNGWRGCSKVSPGCERCYAEAGSHRNPAIFGEWGPSGTRVVSSWLFCNRCRNPRSCCGRGAYETPLDNAAGGCWFRECGCSRIDWVIVGGESGPSHRPCEVEWIVDVVEQCKDAGVPVFVKQDSGLRPEQQGRIPDWAWEYKQVTRP